MALAALAIKFDSRGPGLYLSERVGLDGRSFRMVKFRTMVDDADKATRRDCAPQRIRGGVLFRFGTRESLASGNCYAATASTSSRSSSTCSPGP